VVSVGQIRALRLDKDWVRRQVEGGRLHRLHRGVYAVGHTSTTKHGRYMGAVLACGRGAVLSHRSAADLWGIRRCDTSIAVTVPRGRAGAAGLEVHRCRRLTEEDIRVQDGIPLTSVPRTLLDMAPVLTPVQLGRAVDRAERLDLLDATAIEALYVRASGHRGIGLLQRTLDAWQPRETRSELEDRFQDLVNAAGIPSPRFNVLVDGERDLHEVDAVWPGRRLVAQLDGFAYHRTRRDRERDAATDADLELAGYRVVRLTWDDVALHRGRTSRRLRRLLSDT